ncbi:hypothetical protein PHET_07558 [Paragonimus heterotremus]|uniref:Nipped-B protein n=1 Tax=Paragonimus heterotremus TaxID=100268 RepID=A0A8J4WWS5_9TREM|nr:hypothetical protein PHET_07558 [Paragonimus heterotremus]
MPGDIGRIPIISLGGCKPLSDIINELPVPQSTHVSIGCRTLLYEPRLVHEAYRCINGDDPRLFSALCSALKSVCTDDLTFQDCPQTKPEETTTYPLLLQALLANATFTRADGYLEANAIRDLNPVYCRKILPASSDDFSGNGVVGAVAGQQENSDRESYCSTRIAPLRISLKKTSITCNASEKPFKSKKTGRRKERPQPNNEIPTPSKDTQRLPSSNGLIDPDSVEEISDCQCVLSDPRESALCTAKVDEKPLSPVLLNLAPAVSSGLINHEHYSSAGTVITPSCPAVREQPVNVIDVSDNFKEAACSASSNVTIQSPLGLTSCLNNVPPSINTDCVKPIGSVAPTTNPENVPTTARRVPDPALSQLFHSAALFHTCQPSVDCEKSGLVVSGGLFDDWLDPSGKSSEAVSVSTNNPTVSTECTYSGSISGPSSVIGNPSTCGQAPHSVGTAFDTSAGVTRSPQSVPSNHSSYPATPGVGFPNVPLSVITSVVTPPSVLAKSAITNSAISSPSIRLFDNPESRPDIHESSVDDQPRTAPHGLAAYLPRSSSLRSQLVNDDPTTGLFFEELRPGSPRSNLSSGWDCSDPRSASASEAGSRPTSTGKGLPRTICSVNDSSARHYNESPLLTKPNRGRFPAGKPRGGGRRRRTEVEELRIWNVNDRGQPGTDRKPENGPPAFTSPLLHELKESTVDKIAASNTTNSALNSGSTIGKRKDVLETAQASEHGLFTEALVERVKRRRQQLEIGAQKQTLQLDVPANRSSEASPSSVSSPLRPSGRCVSSSTFTHTSKYLSIPSTNSEGQLDSADRAPTDNSKSHSTVTTIPYKSRRIRSSESESSPSPSSSALSSVPSNQHDVSISSCPDSVPPLSLEELPSDTPVTRAVNKMVAQPSVQTSSSPLCNNNSKTHEPSQVVMSAYKSCYVPSELRERDCPVLNFSECSDVSSSQFMNEEGHHRPTANSNVNNTTCDDESKTLLPPRLEEITMTSLKTDNKSPDNFRKHGYHTSSVERLPSLVPLISVSSNKAERNKQESVKHTVDKLCHSENHDERYSSETVSMKTDCERESCLTVSDSGITENPRSRSGDRCEETIVVSRQNSTTPSSAPSASYQHDPTKLQSVTSKEVPIDKTSDTSRNVADPIDNNSVTVSEQSTGSIGSSSSPLPGTYGELYGSGQRCLTPSTIPYTHSSGMEDSDPRENDCVPLPGENKRHRNRTSSADSDDLSSCRSSIASERSSSRSKFSSSSPSVTSLLEEDGGHCSADNDSDAERIRSEELTISASALTQFTNRLGEILRRVEELDLLKLASSVGLPKSANFHGDDEFCGDSSLIPSTARLSRHELSALYTESAQIRLGGAMYTIPTGRLVRFLTLLLVNMQTGVQLPTSPLTTAEVVRFLERRNKHRHDSSRRIQADQVTESVLWSTPYWTAVLTGLDCVRIALNIVVAPDMPRPLLMEDLVDGIISVTRHALAEILCKIPASVLACTVRQSGQPAGLSLKNLWTFTTECIGYRVSQIMAVLTNLIRFQPNRFTDNLVIRLTGLGLYVPLFCLKSGRSLDRDPKRLSTPLLKRLCSSTSTASESGSSGMANMLLPIGTSRFWLLVWPGHLQRASLSLLAGIYGQYEAHRKLIVDEVFSTLLALCSMPPSGSDNSVIKENHCSPSGDRRTARTFRILSSHWLYTMSKQLKNRTELREDYDPSGVVQSIDASKGQPFVDVHVLTALFLSLTQNLVQVPGSTSTGSASGSGGGSRKSSVGSTEQSNGENAQFCKDEKHVLISYQTAVRHAHYLLSGLFKRYVVFSFTSLVSV